MIEDALLFVALLCGVLTLAEGAHRVGVWLAYRHARAYLRRELTDTRLRRCARSIDEEGLS